MTKRDLLNIYTVIVQLQQGGKPLPIKFTYGLAKNRRLMVNEIEALSEVCNLYGIALPGEDYKAFEKARRELGERLAVKDDKGKAVIVGGSFRIPDQAAAEAGMAELREKHKAALEAQEEKQRKVDELLKEEVKIDLFTIAQEDWPEEMNAAMVDALFPLVREVAA